MKAILIRILFRLIDAPLDERVSDRNKMEDWLVMTWSHPGFRAYLNSRSTKILRELGGGGGMLELSRPDYIRQIGQRYEILRLGALALKTFEKRQRDRAQAGRKPIPKR